MTLTHEEFLGIIRLAPLVSIDLIVRDASGRVLVGLRQNEPAKGCYFVPGGRIHKGQTVAEAFEAVAMAELAVALSPGDATFVGVFDHIYPTNFAGEPDCPTHYVVLAYEVRPAAPPADLPADQHSEWRWLTPEELLADDRVHENTKAYCRR